MLKTKGAFFAVLLTVLMLLTSCGGAKAAQTNLTGTPEEILTKLNDDVAAAGVQMPATMPPAAVTGDAAQNMIGLSAGDFEKYVESAAQSTAAIGTFAHQMIVVKAKDAASAAKVKELVTGEGGYDPKKWICVFPEKAVAVESGGYVLIAAAKADVCDAAVEAFVTAAGTAGEINTFFQGA